MKNLLIEVRDKIATYKGEEEIVCGNSDYTITFSLDEEWADKDLKTARFVWKENGAVKYKEEVFSGDTVNVPVFYNISFVYVGLYAGDLVTTTPARIGCKKSISCETGTNAPPPDDTYNQIVELCAAAAATAQSVEERANNGEFKGEKGDTGATGATGEQGTMIITVDASIASNVTSYKKNGGKMSARKGDLLLTSGNGNLFNITNVTYSTFGTTVLATTLTIKFVATLKGADGADGKDGANGADGADGKDGADGQSVVYSTQSWDILSNGDRPADCYISPDTCTPKAKSGDLIITADGILGRVAYAMSVSNYWCCEFIVSLKGADGKDGAGIPSITDNSTAETPHLDISFGKTGEIRKAFFEQSLLLGQTHYGDGFMQNPDGLRMLMPSLSQNETMATESLVEEGYARTNTSWGYYTKGATEKHEVKPRGLYMVFSTGTENLKLCKSDGTVVVSGASQIIIMTAPYNGNEGDVGVFVAMGMQVGKATLTNLVPVTSVQVELDKGSYITGDSIYYVNAMVKGQ